MAFGNPNRRRASLNVGWMLLALVAASFTGAVLGLIWQSYDWFGGEIEEEHVTVEEPTG
ncbi:hypothetical protein [Aurantiacibacter poecillastricola]|uniref:hypothetical protein n=1 Tax=Aurantiacibacter poecillastricola TaxID=3064385 RepID=UPI00273F4396|nr:hypothetical protein [Aurantiacibacter sp. 219JJ12-13]MDP5261074.1 hypothetical protein [Aurantiacibacter sp. 219JJ12-13]